MDSIVGKRKEKSDYLQVFNVTATEGEIKVANRQEQHYMEDEYIFYNSSISNLKITVWIIDEPYNQTMLFPSDY